MEVLDIVIFFKIKEIASLADVFTDVVNIHF